MKDEDSKRISLSLGLVGVVVSIFLDEAAFEICTLRGGGMIWFIFIILIFFFLHFCLHICAHVRLFFRHERGADGGADLSRPLYSISNPNDAVDRILHTYEENVMGSLHTILEKVRMFVFATSPFRCL
jgi:hypothetical protein